MAAMLETPSRVWRRIEDVEGRDMPSLPSLPVFEDSSDNQSESHDDRTDDDVMQDILPIHSTPAAFSSHTATTIRPPSSTSSTVRFVHSIASRSTKSAFSISRASTDKQTPVEQSFNISSIPSLPGTRGHDEDDLDIRSSDQETEESKESSVPDVYLPPENGGEDDISAGFDLSDALQSISRSNSPFEPDIPQDQQTPSKKYDLSVSLRSEPKPSPFDKMRHVSFRRPLARTRTPSLTRTTPSPSSSSSHSTPHSNHSTAFPRSTVSSPLPALSIPLPPSTNASPVVDLYERSEHSSSMSIDIQAELAHEESNQKTEEHERNATQEMDPTDTEETREPYDREPTFSSEEGTTHSSHQISKGSSGNKHINELRSPLSAFSSPAASAMFTPTPAFQPRPRARFNMPTTTTPPYTQQRVNFNNEDEDDDNDDKYTEQPTVTHAEQRGEPATPFAHKRSFLLSVINSTARPRLKFPTPHPRLEERSQMTPGGPGGLGLNTLLAGVTPRPVIRTRPSQSLVPDWTPGIRVLDTASGSESPYDAAGERASFVSTASSHDLTSNVRANASFDPAIGLGEHGVGRFNAGKLNAYLHGLNRRLQEENETLMVRIRGYEEREKGSTDGVSVAQTPAVKQGRRVSGGGRRVSAGPLGLGDVAEEAAEVWVEEKAALEEVVEELRQELEKRTSEKDGAEKALLEERAERGRDKDRWRDRMGEVERGVEGIVRDLEKKLGEAEQRVRVTETDKATAVREVERRLAEVVVERDVLAERITKAEGALVSGKDLGAELNEANERVGKVMSDLRNSNIQIKELEDEVMRADERIDSLEKELREEKEAYADLEEEFQTKSNELSTALRKKDELDTELQQSRADLAEGKAYAEQLEQDAGIALERIELLEEQVASTEEKLEVAATELEQDKDEIRRLTEEARKASQLTKQMEDALEDAETKMLDDEQQIASLKVKVDTLERELEKAQERSKSHSEPSQNVFAEEYQQDIEALETDLDDAHKEIARLQAILSQSPARKAIDKAKDARIEMLEQEKEGLLDRLKTSKSFVGTPSRLPISAISPMHRQIMAMSIRSPKTPGGPLRDLSWLQSTMQDTTMSPLVAEIARLQRELDRVNESVDDKIDRLEDAGLGIVGLTKKLEDARSMIVTLEDEIGRLSRKEERRTQRLKRVRCAKCLTKVDLQWLFHTTGDESSILEASNISLPSAPPTPPTKTSEALRANLEAVNAQLTSMKTEWEQQKRALLGENAVLQDTAHRLNLQVRNAQNEVKKAVETERAGARVRASLQEELDKAKHTVDDLEKELTAERGRLRGLTTDQKRAEREKEQVVLELQRAEADMADVKQHLQKVKQENHDLETELRATTTAEQKARLLQMKVVENMETIEQLRQERSLLATNYKDLQQQLSEATEHVNKLRGEHARSQTSHDNRRHQLDLQLLEMDDLRRALSNRAEELERAESEKNRIAAEKGDIARNVAVLEADLQRVRRDADMFGRDLKALRIQKDHLEAERKEDMAKAERAQKQAQAQIRVMKEELDGQREKMRLTDERWKGHVCAADGKQLTAMKAQHNKECKGLIVQIRYLKAKFSRESTLRCDLGYQKQYLLILLSRSDRTEQKILAAIARIGFPVAESPPTTSNKRRTLKSVVLSLVFISRAQRASESWRQVNASKEAIAAALQDVRRRRVVVS